jgi:acyl-ACP thioesterase
MGKREIDGIWEEKLQIHSYDVDISAKLTVESLLRYFQEAAWNHAEHLGLGYSHLKRQNLVWVLSRMMVTVDAYPAWGQTVTLQTWPRGSSSLLALRDFEMSDERGRKMLGATSGWLVLDLQSRRPRRVEPLLQGVHPFPDRRSVAEEAARLSATEVSSARAVLEVKYSDLDLNNHVNNAAYARWLLDSYPVEFHRTHSLRSMTLNFLAEIGGDDSVSLNSRELSELKIAHTIRRRLDGAEACRAEIVWENCR